MKKLLTPLLLLLLIVAAGWSIQVLAQEPEVVKPIVTLELSDEPVVLKYNQEFDPQSLVVVGEFEKLDLPVVDTTTIGEKVLVFKAKNEFSSLSKVKVIQVIDDIKPEFTKKTDTIKIEEGQDLDLTKFFEAKDNYDSEIKVSFSGKYDTKKPGSYKVSAQIKDTSKNENSVDFTIEVTEKPKPVVKKEVKKVAPKPVVKKAAPKPAVKKVVAPKKTTIAKPTTTRALYTLRQFMFNGVVRWNGLKFTYYSQRVLPGRGLNIPGRHVNKAGYVADRNGYIVLAAKKPKGTIINTPFGFKGKVYDYCAGCTSNWYDVYIR